MANDLTGDFDVVAEFAIPTINRLLAAMHRIKRFPHSAAMRVDDTHPPDKPGRPSAVEIIDAFGDAIVNPESIRTPTLPPGVLPDLATNSRLGDIVNVDVISANLPPITPSHFKGRAQLQFSPPTMDVVGGSSKIKVRLHVMARYLPDPGTSPAAEFVRGQLDLTVPVNHVASQVANVLSIDIKASSVEVAFTPDWSSTPLSASDRAGIDLLIRNVLKTSFLPSNITLPSTIHSLQVKALTGTQHAVGILLKMSGGAGNAATVNNVFLGAGDDFAFAAGIDFVRSAFQSTIEQILSRPVPPVSFDISTLFGSIHITYTITLRNADVALENGRIVLTINGHAHTGSRLPDFDFTVRQLFTLQPDGATANLVVGDISLHTSSWIVNQFTGGALSALGALRDRAIAESGAVGRIRRMLSAEENLGAFLRSLLKPSTRNDSGPLPPQHDLAYTAVTISPDGIVLHGSLSVRAWPPAHVEFEQIPAQPRGGGPHDLPTSGPEYSAFKSWIPGGMIQSFEWKPLGQTQPGALDDHKFIRLPPPVAVGVALEMVRGYTPLCLTIRGTRLSWTGPVTAEPVTATVCAYDSFPVVPGDFQTAGDGGPLVALTRSGPGGVVEIVGHAPAADAASRGLQSNLIIHFADAKTARRLDRLSEALRDSGRTDAATGIVAVVAKADIGHAPYAPGIVYSDGHEHAWERALRTKVPARPATFILDPRGRIVWRHDGEIDVHQLASVLRKVLVGGMPITTRTLKSNVRIGHPPPNFLFEFAPGHQLTLRKLTGTPIMLVFWRSTSQPSIDAVLRATPTHERGGANGQTLLAINDGEAADVAKHIAERHRLPGILVTDPHREISAMYGVNAWPLSISIDESGVIRELRFGGIGESADRPLQQSPSAAT